MTSLVLIAVLGCLTSTADDQAPAPSPATASPDDPERVRRLFQNPDDTVALGVFFKGSQQEINRLRVDDPEAAAARLDAYANVLDRLSPQTEEARFRVQRQKSMLADFRERIERARMPLSEHEAKVLSSPDDDVPLRHWMSKLGDTIWRTAHSRPGEAQKLLEDGQALCRKVEQATRNERVKAAAGAVVNLRGTWSLHQKMIDEGKQFASRKGEVAEPLVVKSWANTPPISLAELRGRVVLISYSYMDESDVTVTFPYLRRWHETYAGKGLTIVGAAGNPDGSLWNETTRSLERTRRPGVRTNPDFTLEKEHETLTKFAEAHGLKILLATRKPVGDEENYGLGNNAGLVLIDQDGKIHTIRGYPQFKPNVQDIDTALAQLLTPAQK